MSQKTKNQAIAKNPILPGFYPDPSICAVGEDFYLVTSTFTYFPGLPIFHSKDLAHWKQIGNVMTRHSQLPLENAGHSRGLFAPTIRYHKGIFYVICTNVSDKGNFIVTATDPCGPWSEHYYLEGAEGIDPSLFFDDNGKCYYIGTHPNPKGEKYNGDWYIWLQELDIDNMKLIGEHKDIWNGAMKNVIWPEAPHLYKIGEYYYLIHAEGGTGPDHCVSVARSKAIWGPYENNPKNPIITHRHLGKSYPIHYVGHADIVHTKNKEWFMVLLAVRPLEGYTTLGRETFLAKMIWEEDWPIVNPGMGLLSNEVHIHLEPFPFEDEQNEDKQKSRNFTMSNKKIYDFTQQKKLGHEWISLRNPSPNMYEFSPEGLHLRFGKDSLKEKGNPSFLALRQQNHHFFAQVDFNQIKLQEGEAMGLVLLQSNEYYLCLEITKDTIQALFVEAGKTRVLSSLNTFVSDNTIENKSLCLKIQVEGLSAKLFVSEKDKTGEKNQNALAKTSIKSLSTEIAGGFVGCTIGFYAYNSQKTSQEKKEKRAALITKFIYQAL